jgi:hypothetical protein
MPGLLQRAELSYENDHDVYGCLPGASQSLLWEKLANPGVGSEELSVSVFYSLYSG